MPNFEQFQNALVDAYGRTFSREDLLPDARISEDLGFDSIQVFELYVVLEEWGCTFPDDDLPNLTTVQDVFDLYRSSLAEAPPPQ